MALVRGLIDQPFRRFDSVHDYGLILTRFRFDSMRHVSSCVRVTAVPVLEWNRYNGMTCITSAAIDLLILVVALLLMILAYTAVFADAVDVTSHYQ